MAPKAARGILMMRGEMEHDVHPLYGGRRDSWEARGALACARGPEVQGCTTRKSRTCDGLRVAHLLDLGELRLHEQVVGRRRALHLLLLLSGGLLGGGLLGGRLLGGRLLGDGLLGRSRLLGGRLLGWGLLLGRRHLSANDPGGSAKSCEGQTTRDSTIRHRRHKCPMCDAFMRVCTKSMRHVTLRRAVCGHNHHKTGALHCLRGRLNGGKEAELFLTMLHIGNTSSLKGLWTHLLIRDFPYNRRYFGYTLIRGSVSRRLRTLPSMPLKPT